MCVWRILQGGLRDLQTPQYKLRHSHWLLLNRPITADVRTHFDWDLLVKCPSGDGLPQREHSRDGYGSLLPVSGERALPVTHSL